MGEPLWVAEDAAAATGGRLTGSRSWLASGVSIDTRTLAPGDLFVALQDRRDGHEFVAAAFAAGASAAVVSAPEAVRQGPCLVVADTLEALRALGEAARARSPARRVAITGSVGKTSTKEALALGLRASGATHASVKSYNNHWGVPLTLARLPRDSAFGVFECGMNARGEILPLSRLVRPHVAVVTWIAPAHIEALGSLEAIAEEKGDIYAGLEADGAAIVPNEAPHAERLLACAARSTQRIVRFGRARGCEARLVAFEPCEGGAIAEAEIFGQALRYRIGAEGSHWALNSLAVLAAAAAADADVAAAAAALGDLTALEGRGAARPVRAAFGVFTLVDDAYNANPTSMAAAFETLATRPVGPGGRRIVVLGDMLELGAEARAYHAGLAGPLQRERVDLAFAAGPMMASLFDALPAGMRGGYAHSAEALAAMVVDAVREGDVVLVKGSNGSRMRVVVDALARLALGERGDDV